MAFSPEHIASEVRDLPPPELIPGIWDRIRRIDEIAAPDRVAASVQVLRTLAQTRTPSEILIAFHPAGDRQRFFGNLSLLSEVLLALPFTAQDIEALHAEIPPDVMADGAIGLYLNAVRGWAAKNPDEGETLIETCLVGEGRLAGLAVHTVEGLAQASVDSILPGARVVELARKLHEAGPECASASILATPALVAHGLIPLEQFLQDLDQLIDHQLPDRTVATAVDAIRFYWRKGKERARFRDLLRKASSDGRPLVRMALARALRIAWEEADPEDRALATDLLVHFADIPEEHHGAIHEVSWLLYVMAATEPEAVIGFFRAWAAREGEALDLWHSKRFLNVFSQLPKEVSAPRLLRWLIEDSRLEDTALHILVHELKIESVPESEVLALSSVELRILILVLSGLDHHREAANMLASLTLPIVGRSDAATLCGELETALVHGVANFPSLVDRLPQESSLSHDDCRTVVTRLRAHVANLGQLRRLALQLRELACPPDRLELYNRIQAETTAIAIREAQRDDPDRTPFYSMARKISTLTGGRFFSRIGGRFTAPTPFRRFSTSVELPQLPVLDPVSQNLRRAQIRQSVRALRQSLGA